MNSAVSENPGGANWFARIAWTVVILAGGYYLFEGASQYITLDENKYGPYFWPRANMLFPHVIAGSIALIIGPFQFWSRIRNQYKKIHRISGRVYLSAILIGSLAGYAMALTSSVHVVYAAGLFGLSTAWLVTSCMAFISIRNRNISQHKQWMIRSYVVTFAFVTFRISSDLLKHYGILEFPDTAMLMSWVSWVFPLLFTEAVLQWKQATRKTARQA
jgi:uncharacterized membrane protein